MPGGFDDPIGIPDPSCGTDAVAVQNVALAGSIAVVPYTYGAIQILSASDGSVLSTIKGDFFRLQAAPDASYVCTVDTNALTAWATSGSAIASHAGNYNAPASVSCALGEMRIANGPAGASVIERVALPAGRRPSRPLPLRHLQRLVCGRQRVSDECRQHAMGVFAHRHAARHQDLPYQREFRRCRSVVLDLRWHQREHLRDWCQHDPNGSLPGGRFRRFGTVPGDVGYRSAPYRPEWCHSVQTDYPTTPLSPSNLQFAAVSAQQWVVGTYDGAVLDGATLANAPPRFSVMVRSWPLRGAPRVLQSRPRVGRR